jgi:histidinol-phosphate aminotransferase
VTLHYAPSLPRRDWVRGVGSALTALALSPASSWAAPASAASAPRINVSLNENPFGPSPRVTQALRLELRGLERYTEDEARALSQQIAQFEQVPVDQVILGEILEPLGVQLGLQGGPGGEFLYSVPGYPALVDAARPVGGVGVPIPLDSKLDNDLAAFHAKLSSRTRAAFLVNPHNPSGTVNDAEELKASIAELAQKTLVIVDEAYLDYTDDLATRSAVERVRAGDNVLVFRTFSKLHALAALPLGYAIAPLKLAGVLRKQGLGSSHSLNRLAVRAAAASLADSAFQASVRAKVSVERTRWHNVLNELKLRHTDARASFIFFESRLAQAEVAKALAADGIDIGRAFPPLLNWTRISIGLPAENQRVQVALRKLLA